MVNNRISAAVADSGLKHTKDFYIQPQIEQNPLKVGFLSIGENVYKNGTLFTLRFKISPNVPAGNYNIEIKKVNANNDNEKKQECKLVNGIITVLAEETLSVTFTPDTYDINIGGTCTPTAVISPAGTEVTWKWETNDTAIATVDAASGLVTGVSEGTATITATAATADGKTASGSCKVNVTSKAVTGVTLDQSEYTLKVDESFTLHETVLPEDATNKKVTWESKNTAVATVDNGTVKAVAVGTADIVVKTEDGGYEAKCAVTVTDSVVKVTSITLDKTVLSLKKRATETLTATVAPEDATNKGVKWSSSDETVATVDAKGTVTAVKTGTAMITAASAENPDIKAICTVTVEPTQPGELDDIKFTYGQSTVFIGKTYDPTVTLTPSDAQITIMWESSDPAVATVDAANGKLTLVKEGSVKITASVNTKSVKALLSYSVDLKVAPPSITGIKFDFEGTYNVVKNQPYRIYISVTPVEALNDAKIGLKLNKKKIVKIVGFGIDENGKYYVDFEGKKKGTVKLTATCNGLKDVLKIKVSNQTC